jgi:hypothetical protein
VFIKVAQWLNRVPRLLLAALFVVVTSMTSFMMSFANGPESSNERSLNAPSLEYLGFDEAQLSDEASEGLREIFSGRMFYSAVPLSFSKALDAAAAAEMDRLGYDPSTADGRFFRNGSLPSPPNREVDPEISLGEVVFEREGVELKGINCFACHSGVVNGQVVAGLGSNTVMQSPPRPEGTEGPNMFQIMAGLTPAEQQVVAEAMGESYAVNPLTPERTSRGDNFGPFGVWARGAALENPENKGLVVSAEKTELTDIIENNMTPPVNPMPWWLMKYKTFDYWYGDGNPYDAGHFSFNFTGTSANVNDIHVDHVASTAKALAFARETNSPEFPGKLDAELVQKGADIFHERTFINNWDNFRACYRCHGNYTKIGDNPDYSVPGGWMVDYDGTEYENARTDTKYNEIVKAFAPVNEHITKLQTYFETMDQPGLGTIYEPLEGEGYVPPPLVGVWATAPYFHNGSVPTVEAVLNSKLRPEIWARNEDPNAYDLESLGMVYSTFSREELEESDRIMETASHLSRESLDQMFIYDTEGFGRGNMGHQFGDQLTQDERMAVIEFLKSLSGPDMPSASPPVIPDRLAQLGND